MNGVPDQTYFFVHLMKTGGTTFVQHIYANFAPGEIYPAGESSPERRRAYYEISALRELPLEQRRVIRAYTGHFPYIASTLIEPQPTTMTILREPIQRTVSVLRHTKRYQPRLRDATLDEIYDDPFVFPGQIHNYQAKLFAMTRADKLENHMDAIDIDDARLDIARANLERVDVLGLHSHYDAFVEQVRARFGWHIGTVKNLRMHRDTWEVSPSLVERMRTDNAADLSFYEFAQNLYARRNAR